MYFMLAFAIALLHNCMLILIFYFRKRERIDIMTWIGRTYLFLSIPAVIALVVAVLESRPGRDSWFWGLFLGFVCMEAIYDHVLKLDFRSNWRLLVPYLVLYYVANYSMVMVTWVIEAWAGMFMLALFIVQIIVNAWSHKHAKNIKAR